MKNIFYINGQYLPETEANINVSDLGLLRGYGIFDFFRAVNGRILFLEDHLDRFEYSAAQFQLAIPHSRAKLKNIIEQLTVQNEALLLGIKMILTGGYSPDGYTPVSPNLVIVAKPFTFLEKPNGMHLITLDYLRELPEVKSLNYMVPIYNRNKMVAIGADDYLYHKAGFVSELSRSNVFIVKNEEIITPKTNILHGITRKHILKIANEGWKVTEREITLAESLTADEMFTTGSTKKVMAVTKVDNCEIGNGLEGKITKKLQELFQNYEQNYI